MGGWRSRRTKTDEECGVHFRGQTVRPYVCTACALELYTRCEISVAVFGFQSLYVCTAFGEQFEGTFSTISDVAGTYGGRSLRPTHVGRRRDGEPSYAQCLYLIPSALTTRSKVHYAVGKTVCTSQCSSAFHLLRIFRRVRWRVEALVANPSCAHQPSTKCSDDRR